MTRKAASLLTKSLFSAYCLLTIAAALLFGVLSGICEGASCAQGRLEMWLLALLVIGANMSFIVCVVGDRQKALNVLAIAYSVIWAGLLTLAVLASDPLPHGLLVFVGFCVLLKVGISAFVSAGVQPPTEVK